MSLSPEQLQHFRDLLENRARELQDLMRARTEGDQGELSITQPPDSPDDAALVDQLNDDTFAQIQVADGQLGMVRAALGRLDDGTYGICIDCDEPIKTARLEVEPWAERCIECQERQERANPDTAQVPQHRSM